MILPFIITLLVIYIVLYLVIYNKLYHTSLIDTNNQYKNLPISRSHIKQKHDMSITHNTNEITDKRSTSTAIFKSKSQSPKLYKVPENSDSKHDTIPTSTTSSTFPRNKTPPHLSLPRPTDPYIHNNMIFPDNIYYANNTCIYTHFEPIHQALTPPTTPDPIYRIDAIYVVHYTLLKKRKTYINKHVYDIFGIYPTIIEAFDKQALTSSILECFTEPGRDMQRKVLNNTITYLG